MLLAFYYISGLGDTVLLDNVIIQTVCNAFVVPLFLDVELGFSEPNYINILTSSFSCVPPCNHSMTL